MPRPPSRPRARARARWRCLLRPKWLAWHAFAVLAAAGMLGLGDWQLHRAEAGNELSWAYTFEWPLFAVLGAVFWVKTLKEELRTADTAGQGEAGQGASDQGAVHQGSAGQGAGDQGAGDGGAVTAAGTPGRPGTGSHAAGEAAGTDPAARSPAAAGTTDYAAQLRMEVRGHGRWHGLR
jgi:hypothetical protein